MSTATALVPGFHLEGYIALLEALRDLGYTLAPVTAMPDRSQRCAHIRHDIDLHLEGIDRVARAEAAIGVRATYYVLLTSLYSPLSEPSIAVLRELVALGHELGLHYDLQLYPQDPIAAKQRLDLEASLLGVAVGCPVRTIVRHQPSLGGGDPFLQNSGYLNAHDPAYEPGMRYFSDSCRLWREAELRRVLTGIERPERLHLNTHPESWLDGSIQDPTRYISERVLPASIRQQQIFFNEKVAGLWQQRHDAGAQGPEKSKP